MYTIMKGGYDMDNKTYDAYRDALDAASGDRDLQKKILAQAIAEEGMSDHVKLLEEFHT